MIQVGYYPGCALHGTAAEYDESLQAVCQALDISLVELEDWNCCGASSAHCFDETLAVQLAERNLRLAGQVGQDLLVPCAACFHRLKYAEKRFPESKRLPESQEEKSRVVVWHVNEFFHRPELVQRLSRQVQRPLRGLAGVPYYGCLTQRPPKITDAPQPEYPTTMDTLMEAVGMEVRPWSYKTDCCGGSLEVARPDLVAHLCGRLVEAAREAGADCIVTACPMCQANLDISQAEAGPESPPIQMPGSTQKLPTAPGESAGGPQVQATRPALPVFYITELMALALGVGQYTRWWRRHLVDVRPLLQQKGWFSQ